MEAGNHYCNSVNSGSPRQIRAAHSDSLVLQAARARHETEYISLQKETKNTKVLARTPLTITPAKNPGTFSAGNLFVHIVRMFNPLSSARALEDVKKTHFVTSRQPWKMLTKPHNVTSRQPWKMLTKSNILISREPWNKLTKPHIVNSREVQNYLADYRAFKMPQPG
ncbi:hypothetical protein ElyMa_006013900 [Elysia marginata]|uniref:Uncharacterized protein n=1 Tax=Elysia marginata TaxID=1093978 RepID=A0AAV4GHY9_9GAST|nr:hypothetical protein ElyMa_006013900 [Elysia marginata]